MSQFQQLLSIIQKDKTAAAFTTFQDDYLRYGCDTVAKRMAFTTALDTMDAFASWVLLRKPSPEDVNSHLSGESTEESFSEEEGHTVLSDDYDTDE